MTAWALRGVCVVVWLLAVAPPAWAADFLGQVLFNGQPVPGATVTATRQSTAVDAAGEKKVTLSDAQGVYRFPDLAEGMWTVQVEMFGFAPASRDVRIPPEGAPPVVELTLLPLAEMTRGLPPPVPVAPAAATAPAAPGPGTSSAARGSGQAGSGVRPRARSRAGRRRFSTRRRQSQCRAGGVDSGRRERLPRRRQRRAQRRRHGRGRRTADQRQRQQRRRVALRAGARLRQQPARAAAGCTTAASAC